MFKRKKKQEEVSANVSFSAEKQKNNSNVEKSHRPNLLKLFFGRYTLIGVLFILFSLLVAQIEVFDNFPVIVQRIQSVCVNIFETIGIAFFLGSIFDFSKNTAEFLSFVSKLLSEIVVSKDFLRTLTQNDKNKALELILKPTNSQLEQYSNIKEYFTSKIEESTEMFSTNFRSHMTIYVIIKKDLGKVVADIDIRYRIYKIKDKYEPLILLLGNCSVLLRIPQS